MKVWKYGDNINTDMLFPGKYTYTCSTPEEVTPHLFEDLDASFAKNANKGDVIFAGKNFGCGSSREQPVIELDVDKGTIVVGGKTFTFPKLPREILAIRDAGGLLAYTRSKLKKKD